MMSNVSTIRLEFRDCWIELLEQAGDDVRRLAAELVERFSENLADEFYEYMMSSPRARPFLNHAVVNFRLRASMRDWLMQIFTATTDEERIDAMIARQIELGAVHARLKMPIDLITRGMTRLQNGLDDRAKAQCVPMHTCLAMHRYVVQLMALCNELIIHSYASELQRATRMDESYLLLAQRRESAVEKERQRALLSEWAQETLFAVATSSRRGTLVSLGDSNFGVWIKHKAKLFFVDEPDLLHVIELMTHIDDAILPQLRPLNVELAIREKQMETLASKIDLIRYLMADLFSNIDRSEDSIDAITRLPNRRYLGAVLTREIEEHAKSERKFCILLVRPAELSMVEISNTTSNQAMYLQQFSSLLMSLIRPSDYLFRYHDDQFLLVAVESSFEKADWLATQINMGIRSNRLLSRPEAVHTGARIGIAEFDGHRDYEYLMRRAERALLEAISSELPDAVLHG